MRNAERIAFTIAGIMLAASAGALAAPVCAPNGTGKLKCTIAKVGDCDQIRDYPYARDLFCPAAFAAVQTMVDHIAETLDVKDPAEGAFHYHQTLADPLAPPDSQAQTTVPCLDTAAPYPSGSKWVVGAGTPLCHLVAYVTSPGPSGEKPDRKDPVPKELRTFPDYFAKLYSPEKGFPLTHFRTGSAFDPIVGGFGAAARDGFIGDYKKFSPTKLYDPHNFEKDDRYHGISGGGGGGWGGEIGILDKKGPLVQLAFGGGGGGGLTSYQRDAATTPASGLGGGGGAGMQFANGYRSGGKSYNGLGLGAGVGSSETSVEYSYNDFDGSGRPKQPVHQYNAAVIADYEKQLKNLADQLKSAYKSSKTIVLRGGGGMGAGTEYLKSTGQEFEPHALSTQAGFQFSYSFFRGHSNDGDLGAQALASLDATQQDVYEVLGDAYRTASQLAFEQCGRDYSEFACMCPRQHAIVICLVREQVSKATEIPGWLQQRHCPGDPSPTSPPSAFSSYQTLLLSSAPALPAACNGTLTDFFTDLNTPIE